jgi:PIF1-like helicase
MRSEKYFRVPDFIGGALPRSDIGDREFYCSTMLTLFKPWRSGESIKTKDQSWEDAFDAYKFTERQIELMLFFNIKYECLDGRDDYAAQRKKEALYGDNPYSQDFSDNLDDLHNNEFVFDNIDDDEMLEADISGRPGNKNIARLRNMEEMKNIAIRQGWTDKSKDGKPDYINIERITPDIYKDSVEWRSDVLTMKKKVIDEKRQFMNPILSNTEAISKYTAFDTANIVNSEFLLKDCKSGTDSEKTLTENISTMFSLNKEQDRAFKIIANHANSKSKQQLKMYMGGMGGTGKSQVIKALIKFFEDRHEAHRFIVLAPTGSAAALLSGSTYHSVLNIFEGIKSSPDDYAKIRGRLHGVDYIFLDEVSMLSCHDMYNISAQLAKALNIFDVPFGGLNIIFAGDFAQLPPPMQSHPLYSEGVHSKTDAALKPLTQEAVIGKALWHQITTVVILRQNMRQLNTSEDDVKFRTALENMRYKDCTPSDIEFLKTRVAGFGPNSPKLSDKRFKNVSVITALNAHKDALNILGSENFAKETGQTLTHFYSIDTLAKQPTNAKISKRAHLIYKAGKIGENLQKELWDLPHGATAHIPGKLSLCIGLPVMIRKNDATELCITKGQEGTVVGWTAKTGPNNQQCLDTLFVKLTNAPTKIKFSGLPEQVVPLTSSSQQAICYLSDDTVITINRNQISILPNFAMTDYASQGKTRPNNVVNAMNCKGHQSIYTCLSRGSTAAGTILLQNFSSSKVTGGCSGHLRQEYRELDLLDEITQLRYDNLIPSNVSLISHTRNSLIRQFRLWKGLNHVPKHTHSSITWSSDTPFPLDNETEEVLWELIDQNKKTKQSSKNSTNYNKVNKKRKADYSKYVPATAQDGKRKSSDSIISVVKKSKTDHIIEVNKRKLSDTVLSKNKKININNTAINVDTGPTGVRWDSVHYSCAYDTLFTILFSIWISDSDKWSNIFINTNTILSVLSDGFEKFISQIQLLEQARDTARQILHTTNTFLFPAGPTGMNITDLAEYVSKSHTISASTSTQCSRCNISKIYNISSPLYLDLRRNDLNIISTDSISTIVNRLFNMLTRKCNHCHTILSKIRKYNVYPDLFIVHLPLSEVEVSLNLEIETHKYNLKGVIYFGHAHYTARIIVDNNVWYNDSISTGRDSVLQNTTDNMSNADWLRVYDRDAVLYIYSK